MILFDLQISFIKEGYLRCSRMLKYLKCSRQIKTLSIIKLQQLDYSNLKFDGKNNKF